MSFIRAETFGAHFGERLSLKFVLEFRFVEIEGSAKNSFLSAILTDMAKSKKGIITYLMMV